MLECVFTLFFLLLVVQQLIHEVHTDILRTVLKPQLTFL